MRHLRLFEVGPSWGGYESLINYLAPGVEPELAERMGFPPRLFRVSVGLESAGSLIADLNAALDEV